MAAMLKSEFSGVPLLTSFSNRASRLGKRWSRMTFMLGAHATMMARWFSMTAHSIVMLKRYVKSGFVACVCTK